MLRRMAAIVVTAAAIVASAGPVHAQEAVNTVTVGASETVDVEADIGIASFGVRTKDRSAKEAASELSEKTTAILAALRDEGFTNDELSTANMRLTRQCISKCRDHDPKDGIPPERIMGYVGSAAITVETTQLDRLGRAVDAAVGAGADSIRGISYDVEDKDAAVLEALRQAMQMAKAKGEVIAQEAGRTLGPALLVEEGRTSAPDRYSLVEDVLPSYAGGSAGSGGDSPSESIPFPIEPPTLKASARVTVTWELI